SLPLHLGALTDQDRSGSVAGTLNTQSLTGAPAVQLTGGSYGAGVPIGRIHRHHRLVVEERHLLGVGNVGGGAVPDDHFHSAPPTVSDSPEIITGVTRI